MVHLSHLIYSQTGFRSQFFLQNKNVLRWFPGHMNKGVKQMQQKLKSVDCIVEVHDARIPFSGRNPKMFQSITGLRPHVLVYNKKDLADSTLEGHIIDYHKSNGFEHVVFTNCKDNKCIGIKQLVPIVQKLILSSCRYNRTENLDYCLMVIGVPNVGKSSLINVLRNRYLLKGGGVHVGAQPGITRSVGQKIKISEDPLVFVLDTPGILTPSVPSVEVGMKLALCATIPDKEVGIELVADFLLFWLNKNGIFSYTSFFDIDEPCDNISEVLTVYALNKKLMLKLQNAEGGYVFKPDFTQSASHFVEAFRKGLFGRYTLDRVNFRMPRTKVNINGTRA